MKLRTSTFISIVLAFLMFLGYQGSPVEVIEDPTVPDFTYTIKGEGPSKEKVRIEIFDDLECKDCMDLMKNTLPKIRNLEQETGKIDLRLYFVPDIYNELWYKAALSIKCAADQDGFWGMHEKIHDNKDVMTEYSFGGFTKELGINEDPFRDCCLEKVYEKAIEDDIKYASDKNLSFMPTILINEYKMIGNPPFENIQKIINDFLEEKEIIFDLPDKNTDLRQELEILEVPIVNP